MQISGPDRYELTFDPATFSVSCPRGTPRFSGIATSKKPKLYVVSAQGRPIYIGVTKQPLRNRLRLGWSADGESGYYGYQWRHHLTEASIDIWCHDDAPGENPILDFETIEAEVVFLVRRAGQWPLYQTEIHFHQSTTEHREVAARIMSRYVLPVTPLAEHEEARAVTQVPER